MIQNITPTELKAKLDANEDILIIDVRNPHELEISQVDFATHIVLSDIPNRMDDIPEDKTVVFICRSGARSMQACNFLVAQGFDSENLLNLDGGILAWARDVDPSLPTFY